MKPDSELHMPSRHMPAYLRSLIEGAEFSQRYVADRIGVAPRTLRAYLAGDRPVPYTVQYAIEKLCKKSRRP